jgi:hypothetical protein
MPAARRRASRTHRSAWALVGASLALGISACGGASTPSGAYTATIPATGGRLAKQIGGTWTVAFSSKGYTITNGSEEGLAIGKGSYVRGTTFVINPLTSGSCGPGRGTGTYRLKLSGSKLTFIRVTDPCKTRSLILSRTFTKAG